MHVTLLLVVAHRLHVSVGADVPPPVKCLFCWDTFLGHAPEQASWDTLWHPFMMLYSLHFLCAFFAIIASVHYPKALIVVMILSGLCFPICLLGWNPTQDTETFDIHYGFRIWDNPAWDWEHACYMKLSSMCAGPAAVKKYHKDIWYDVHELGADTKYECAISALPFKYLVESNCSFKVKWIPACTDAPRCMPDKSAARLDDEWVMVSIKWLIVNIMACVPVLSIRAFHLGSRFTELIGWLIHISLGLNIVWTLAYPIDGWVRLVNASIAMSLTVSLVIHMLALFIHGQPIMEKRHGFVYSRGTPFSWLICYTSWNALFVADFSIQMTFQDVLFWAMMMSLRNFGAEDFKIECYFAYARPVELGTYIAVGCWSGLLPYFQNAASISRGLPALPVNSHSYFLFLAILNFCYSLRSLVNAFQYLCKGPPQSRDHRRLSTLATTSLIVQINDKTLAMDNSTAWHENSDTKAALLKENVPNPCKSEIELTTLAHKHEFEMF